MSDSDDDSDDLVRRAMNGSDLDSTEPSDDDSDDTSLDSDDASFLSLDSADIAEDDRAAETQFEDDEDAEAFRGVSRHVYRELICPLKRGEAKFLNYNFHSQLSDLGRGRLGGYLASATGIRQMHVTLVEQQPTHLGRVFGGSFTEDHELRRLKIRHPEDSEGVATLVHGDWDCICQYLKKASLLQHLDLSYLDLDSGMTELEGRIGDLETKNRDLLKEVDALREENESLMLENDALKSGTGRAGEKGDGNAKKRSRPGR